MPREANRGRRGCGRPRAAADIRLLIDVGPRSIAAEKLSTQIAAVIETLGRPNNLAVRVEVDDRWDDLSKDCTEDVVRIVRECLRNVVKHAKASTVSIRIPAVTEDVLLIEITDDGIGYGAGTASHGFGLSLINEKALERGGNYEASVDGSGTTMRVKFVPEFESDWQIARRLLEAQIQASVTDT